MANKVQIPYYGIANIIYITIRDSESKVWHVINKAFEIWDDAKIANYVVNSVYKEGSIYSVDFPIDISNGFYMALSFIQEGVSPNVSNDIWIGSGSYYWDKDKNNLVGVRADTLIEYSSGERFTSKALSIVSSGGLLVNIDHDTDKIIIERNSDPTFTQEE